jgi:hypothetical protein
VLAQQQVQSLWHLKLTAWLCLPQGFLSLQLFSCCLYCCSGCILAAVRVSREVNSQHVRHHPQAEKACVWHAGAAGNDFAQCGYQVLKDGPRKLQHVLWLLQASGSTQRRIISTTCVSVDVYFHSKHN